MHDPLTDLPNRALLSDRLIAALCPSATTVTDTPRLNALLLLDLNNFKRVNDALGHASGDLLLIELANRLQRIADPHDTVARLGGDEFAVLMPGDDETQALELANRCAIVLSAPWKVTGVTINPRVTIGTASSHDAGNADGRSDASPCRHGDVRVQAQRWRSRRLRRQSGELDAERLRLLSRDRIAAEP